MPAPTNISAATATPLGTLPATVTQTVDDSGTTYTVWYSFVAPAGAVVVGAFGFGDLVTYRPTLSPWEGNAASPTQVLSIAGQNVAIQFPVTPGTTYFLKALTNGGNPSPAVLTLNVQVAPALTAPVGAIAVNDDTAGFPLALLSSTANYTVQQFVSPFPNGEEGDVLANGTLCVEDRNASTIAIYSNRLGLLNTLTPAAARPKIRTNHALQVFYVGVLTNPVTVKTITAAGAFGATTYTLTGVTSMDALAANNAGTILYHASGGVLKRWNLPGGVALTDLAGNVAGYTILDILVLTDDTIVASYFKGTVTRDLQVIHYSTDGTVLNTYTYGTSFSSSTPKLAYAIADPVSFWVWFHLGGANAGISRFVETKVSDGTALTTRDQAEFETGKYQPAETATPLGRFGPSFSCPFWIVRTAIPSVTTTTYPIRRMRRFLLPSSPDNKTLFLHYLELLLRTGVGNSDAPDPQVMLRISRDGGKTWGTELWRSAGAVGEFHNRVRWLRMGRYRNAVVEVTLSDPVDWQLVSMMGTVSEGES